MNVKVTKIKSQDLTKEFKTKQELLDHLETITNNDFVNVELRQLVPNPKKEEKTIASLTHRLLGHEKKIEIKDEKNLVTFIMFTKESALDFDIELEKEYYDVTLVESYVPIYDLNEKFGRDKLGNITETPSIRLSSNEVVLYKDDENNLVPYFRKIELKNGIYTPCLFNTVERTGGYIPHFKGETKLDTGRKTPEYQKWLNNLFNQYVSPEEAIFENTNAVFQTAE